MLPLKAEAPPSSYLSPVWQRRYFSINRGVSVESALADCKSSYFVGITSYFGEIRAADAARSPFQ